MSTQPNLLGDYLRARRGLVTPAQAGIADHGTRRVPGLRREEVAMLAGISADYYLRLERGRDRNPSTQVLEAIARVLRLDESGVDHLTGLVGDGPRPSRRRPPHRETVPTGIARLVSTLPHPAYVEGRYLDVLAANPLATALSPAFAVGRNQLRDLFLDPAERDLYPTWDGTTACLIGTLRQAVGTDTADPRLVELTGELSLASPRFRELWARHDVKEQYGARMPFRHPGVGELTLNRERLAVGGAEHLKLVVLHPDAGSSDAEKIALLASTLGADRLLPLPARR